MFHFWYYTNVVDPNMYVRRCLRWQNVISAARALILEITSAILIEDPTESGIPTSRKSLWTLTALRRECMSAPAALDPARSSAIFNIAAGSGSSQSECEHIKLVNKKDCISQSFFLCSFHARERRYSASLLYIQTRSCSGSHPSARILEMSIFRKLGAG